MEDTRGRKAELPSGPQQQPLIFGGQPFFASEDHMNLHMGSYRADSSWGLYPLLLNSPTREEGCCNGESSRLGAWKPGLQLCL